MTEIPGYQRKHLRWVNDYAERHFTDPGVALEDAAVFYDVNVRTLRRSLAHCGTGWRVILRELRLQRATELLERTTFKVEWVARLAGYNSASAFGKSFRQRYSSTPSQYRRGKRGPARVGGPTGAFDHGRHSHPDDVHGWGAMVSRELFEARERLNDRRQLSGEPRDESLFGSWDEVEAKRHHPRWLRQDAARWKRASAQHAKGASGV